MLSIGERSAYVQLPRIELIDEPRCNQVSLCRIHLECINWRICKALLADPSTTKIFPHLVYQPPFWARQR